MPGGTCQQQLLGLAEMRRAEASAKHQLQRDLRGLERAYARLERSNAKLQTDLDVSVTGSSMQPLHSSLPLVPAFY